MWLTSHVSFESTGNPLPTHPSCLSHASPADEPKVEDELKCICMEFQNF